MTTIERVALTDATAALLRQLRATHGDLKYILSWLQGVLMLD